MNILNVNKQIIFNAITRAQEGLHNWSEEIFI